VGWGREERERGKGRERERERKRESVLKGIIYNIKYINVI